MVLVGGAWYGRVLALYFAFFIWYAVRRAHPPEAMNYYIEDITTRTSGVRVLSPLLEEVLKRDRLFHPGFGLSVIVFYPVIFVATFLAVELALDLTNAFVISTMLVIVLGAVLLAIGFDRIFPMEIVEPFSNPEARNLRTGYKNNATRAMIILLMGWGALILLVVLVPNLHSQSSLVVWGSDALIIMPAGSVIIYIGLFTRSAHRNTSKGLANGLERNVLFAIVHTMILFPVLCLTGFWPGGLLFLIYTIFIALLIKWTYRAHKNGDF